MKKLKYFVLSLVLGLSWMGMAYGDVRPLVGKAVDVPDVPVIAGLGVILIPLLPLAGVVVTACAMNAYDYGLEWRKCYRGLVRGDVEAYHRDRQELGIR